MASVCFYFQVHQPFRLRRYSVFDTDRHYFDEYKNAEICRKVAQRCYLPANKLMLENIKMHEGRFRIAYSISGVAIEQFEQFAPEVMETFQELNATGCVEFLDETYYHSLAFLYSRDEFRAQVDMHRKLMKRLFNQEPPGLPQYRADLQQRPGPLRQPYGLRRHPRRGRRSGAGRPQPQ